VETEKAAFEFVLHYHLIHPKGIWHVLFIAEEIEGARIFCYQQL